MANKINWRLTLVTVAVLVVLAIAVGAFLTLNSATAKADGEVTITLADSEYATFWATGSSLADLAWLIEDPALRYECRKSMIDIEPFDAYLQSVDDDNPLPLTVSFYANKMAANAGIAIPREEWSTTYPDAGTLYISIAWDAFGDYAAGSTDPMAVTIYEGAVSYLPDDMEVDNFGIPTFSAWQYSKITFEDFYTNIGAEIDMEPNNNDYFRASNVYDTSWTGGFVLLGYLDRATSSIKYYSSSTDYITAGDYILIINAPADGGASPIVDRTTMYRKRIHIAPVTLTASYGYNYSQEDLEADAMYKDNLWRTYDASGLHNPITPVLYDVVTPYDNYGVNRVTVEFVYLVNDEVVQLYTDSDAGTYTLTARLVGDRADCYTLTNTEYTYTIKPHQVKFQYYYENYFYLLDAINNTYDGDGDNPGYGMGWESIQDLKLNYAGRALDFKVLSDVAGLDVVVDHWDFMPADGVAVPSDPVTELKERGTYRLFMDPSDLSDPCLHFAVAEGANLKLSNYTFFDWLNPEMKVELVQGLEIRRRILDIGAATYTGEEVLPPLVPHLNWLERKIRDEREPYYADTLATDTLDPAKGGKNVDVGWYSANMRLMCVNGFTEPDQYMTRNFDLYNAGQYEMNSYWYEIEERFTLNLTQKKGVEWYYGDTFISGYVKDESGDLVLDGYGNPIPTFDKITDKIFDFDIIAYYSGVDWDDHDSEEYKALMNRIKLKLYRYNEGANKYDLFIDNLGNEGYFNQFDDMDHYEEIYAYYKMLPGKYRLTVTVLDEFHGDDGFGSTICQTNTAYCDFEMKKAPVYAVANTSEVTYTGSVACPEWTYYIYEVKEGNKDTQILSFFFYDENNKAHNVVRDWTTHYYSAVYPSTGNPMDLRINNNTFYGYYMEYDFRELFELMPLPFETYDIVPAQLSGLSISVADTTYGTALTNTGDFWYIDGDTNHLFNYDYTNFYGFYYINEGDGDNIHACNTLDVVGWAGDAKQYRQPESQTWYFKLQSDDKWTEWTESVYPKNAGAYDIKYEAKWEHNKYVMDPLLTTATIAPKTITLAWSNTSGYTYDANVHDVSLSWTGMEWGEEANVLDVTYTKGISAAGSHTITATAISNTNYALPTDGSEQTTLVIGQRKLTVTADNKSINYGDAAPQQDFYSVSYSGFQGTDGAKDLAGSVTYTCAYAYHNEVGPYTIVLSGTLANSNYDIEYANGTLTVAPKAITVTATDKESVYGDELLGLVAIDTGILAGDDIDSVYTLSVGDMTRYSDVGGYTITVTSKGNKNYNVSTVNGTYTLTQREVTLSWQQDRNFDYNGLNQVPTVEAGNTVNGDTVTVTVDGAQKNVRAAAYTATATGLDNGNYKLPAAVTTEFYIKKVNLTITANSFEITAGDPVTYTVKYEGWVNGETVAVLKTNNIDYKCGYVQATSGNGVYPIDIQDSDVTSDNYNIILRNGSVSVGYTLLTVTIKNKETTYGTLYTYTVDDLEFSGFIGEETYTVLSGTLQFNYGSYAQFANKGDYTINASGWTSDKYNVQFVPGTLKVNAKDITVTAVNRTETYGNSTVNWTVSATTDGIVNNDSNVYTVTCVANVKSDANAEGYVIDVEPAGNTNYNVTAIDGKFVVLQREVTLAWANDNLTYNGADQVATATAGNVVTGDSVNVTVNGYRTFAGQGTATAIALSNTNYKLPTANTHNFTIAPAQITVIVGNKYVEYGSAASEYIVDYLANVSGTIYGTDEVFSLSCSANSKSPYGSYTIGIVSANNANYEFVGNKEGTLYVRQRVVTVTWGDTEFTYNGTEQAPSVTIGNVIAGDDAALNVLGKQLNAGNGYTATADLTQTGNNYVLPEVYTTKFNIAAAKVTIKANDAQSIYGDEVKTSDLSALVTSGQLYDAAKDVYTLSTNADATQPVGNWYYVKVNPAENDNYIVNAIDGTFTIGKRTVSLAWTGDSYVYDKTAKQPTVKVNNTVNNDVIGANLSGSGIEVGDNYSVSVTELTGDKKGNYQLPADVAHAFVITPTVVKVTADAKSIVYGGDVLPLTEVVEGNIYEGDAVYTIACEVTSTEARSAVATYDIVITDLNNPNYAFSKVDAIYTITPAVVNVTAVNRTSVYGDKVVALNETVEGTIYEGDEVYTIACVASNLSNVGSYDIVVTNLENPNYTFTSTNAKYTITARPLTVTIDKVGSIYGDAQAELVYSITSGTIAAQDTEAAVYEVTCAVDNTSAVGGYDIVGNKLNNNYAITFVVDEKAYTVSQREVTLTWGTAEFTYVKGTEYLPTVEVGNLVNGNVVKATVDGAKKVAGSFTATVTALDNANYKLPADVTKAFVINKAASAIDLSAMVKSQAYTGKELTFVGATSINDEADIVYSGNKQTKVGKYTVTVSVAETANFLADSKTVEIEVVEAEPVKGEDGKQEFYKDIDDTAAADKGVDIKAIIANAAKAGENAGLTLNIGAGEEQSTIVLDAAAIASLNGKDVAITFKTIEGEEAAAAQKGAALVMEISLGAEFEGSATITVPFVNNAPGGKVAKVFYVDENGKKVNMNGTFENDTVTFTTTHFSTYVVDYVLSTGVIVGIVVAIVAVIAAVVVVLIVLKKKKAAPATAAVAESTSDSTDDAE